MKINPRWLAGVLTLALLALPAKCFGLSACVSARFNDYQDLGCHATPGRPGSLPPGMSNPGGAQAQCIKCEGMPKWWVNEPYINLWAADEPLSYMTSSGQQMKFRWTYKQRGQLDFPWSG